MWDSLQLLIKSNMKKSIRTSLAFLLLILVTVLLYHTGSQLTDGFKRLYREKSAATNSADFAATLPSNFCEKYQDEITEFKQLNHEISEMEITDAILIKNADLQDGEGNSVNGSWTFRNADRKESISSFDLVERLDQIPKNGIYMPYVCKTFFGFQLGDTLKISYAGQQAMFIVAGFTEEVLFGTRSYMAFDLPANQFYSFREKVGIDASASIILLKTSGTINDLTNKFSEFVAAKGDEVDFYSNSDIEYAENSRKSNINIYVVIINIASLIGIIACFNIIGFHMNNTLDKDSKELGALKAIGYTGELLVLSYMIQFLLLGLLGAVLGVAGSEIIMPAIIGGIATDIGFVWKPMFLGWLVVRDILIVLLIIAVITLFLSRGIIKLRPVEAFQGKRNTSSRKRNNMTIEKTPFSADLSIALKMMISERTKSIFVIITVAIIMCVAGFSVILYARLVKDKEGLLQITGAEIYSVNVQLYNLDQTEEMAEKLKKTEARKVMLAIEPGTTQVLCEDNVNASLGVYSDYSALENPSIYTGRYPKHKNEIAISGNLANSLDKEVGDTIKIAQIFQETVEEKEFLITGFTQGTYTGGNDIFLTMDGVKQINPNAEWQTIHIYLDDNVNTEQYCNTLEEEFSQQFSYVGGYEQIFYTQFAPIVNSVSGIVSFIMLVMLLIIIIMGYFVTNSILLTRKSDFGIMKALGYSTQQIVEQAAITFMLFIAGGSILSGILLYYFSDSMIVNLFRSMGIHKISFQFPLMWIILLVLCVEIIGCFTAVISALKVRKIVPSNLIKTE